MTGSSPRELDDQKLFRAVGQFFADHALDPTPENYALVYELARDEDSPVARMIIAITGDGIRLSQADADRIRTRAGIEVDEMPRAGTSDADTLADARRSIEGFSEMVDATHAEARSYGADLQAGAAALAGLPGDHPAVAGVARITGAMLQRTRAAEAQLDAARSEAATLRARLAEAEEEARSDPLTHLPNRRALDDRLAEILADGSLCSVAICDVDRFKAVNDRHGHGVGDRVLRAIAQTLQASCGAHMVARLGGEEFVILFEGLAPADAAIVLNEARETLAARNFKVRGTDAPLGQITFSAGIATCCRPDADEPPLKRADNLLYQAKNGGRNCVVVEED